MHQVSARQRKKGDGKPQDVAKDDARSKSFGEEGTNKTQPIPDPSAKPSDVSIGGKHVEPSPYTR
jgi:hypothetical protein